jgi:hypothetical protein
MCACVYVRPHISESMCVCVCVCVGGEGLDAMLFCVNEVNLTNNKNGRH